MQGEGEAIGDSARLLQKSASARTCKRPGPSPRVLLNGRRRDRGGQQAQGGVGTCSPATSSRRMSLGGNSVRVREEFMGSPARMSTPTGGHHGRHGIRYQKSHSDTFLEEVKQEDLQDLGATRPSPGKAASFRRPGENSHDTIAEEDGQAVDEEEGRRNNGRSSLQDGDLDRGVGHEEPQHEGQGDGRNPSLNDGQGPDQALRENGRHSRERDLATDHGEGFHGEGSEEMMRGGNTGDGQSSKGGGKAESSQGVGSREEGGNSATQGVELSTLEAFSLARSVSPASVPTMTSYGGVSPGRPEQPTRQRVNSWATLSSPPVLSGPFSRSRPKSRSPRGLSIGGADMDGLPPLPLDSLRVSGEFGRPLVLSAEPSICSASEEVAVWNEGEMGLASAGQALVVSSGQEEGEGGDCMGNEEMAAKNGGGGAFSGSALEMARLRLPNMELGFEDENFFDIDPRRLIIGQEIARGAFGVVHEAVLLEHASEEEVSVEAAAVEGEEQDENPKCEMDNGSKGSSLKSEPSGGDGSKADTVSDTVPSRPDPVAEANGKADQETAGTGHPRDGDEEEGEGSRKPATPAGQSGTRGTEEEGTGETSGEEGNVASAANAADAVNPAGAPGASDAAAIILATTSAEDTSSQMNTKEARASVAVKIQQVPVDEEEQANLLGELAMLRNYAHPHLVEYIGTALAMERGVDTVMIAMEWCTNGALREALKLNISWPLKVRIARDMTDGLQFLHAHGIIHRDIKTPNVLIDRDWRAKLCDYNFAIDESSSIKQDFCAGTAEFMSPEVLMSEDYGLSSDIFSLGMIFVEMLTGKEPSATFPERPPQAFFVVNEDEIQAELLDGCPSSFSLLQSQCLFAEASERPTAEDAYGWLQDLLNEMGEDEIKLPKRGPPLPVLTEGAAIAREGNVINTSPKGTEHHWVDTEAMELQISSMVENAVERALAERAASVMVEPETPMANAGDEETRARLAEMGEEINLLRTACEERDSRISALEVQALRNNTTLKMLSSALEVAYKMLEGQQAARLQSTSFYGGTDEALPDGGSGGRDSVEHGVRS